MFTSYIYLLKGNSANARYKPGATLPTTFATTEQPRPLPSVTDTPAHPTDTSAFATDTSAHARNITAYATDTSAHATYTLVCVTARPRRSSSHNGACHVSQIPPQLMAHPNQESVIPIRTSSSPNHLVTTPQNKSGFLDSNTPQPSSVYSSYQQTMNANNTPQNKPGFLDSNTPQPSSVYSSYQQTMNVNNTWLSSSQASHVLQPQALQNQASLEIAPARNPSGNQFANKSLQQYLDKPVHMQVREKARRMVTTWD